MEELFGRLVSFIALLYLSLELTIIRKSCDMLSLVGVTPEVALVSHSLYPTVATTVLGAVDLSPNYP